MRIAFICPVFPPEPAPAGHMARELATALAAAGHEVSIFTQFPNRPSGKIYPGYRRNLTSVERMDGFEVIRCPHWVLGRDRRSLSRALENLTFGISSGLHLLLRKRPDVVIIETWPLCSLTIALAICRTRRLPSLNYVQDLYPEVLEHTGKIREGSLIGSLLRGWDGAICNGSSHTIAISDGMKSLICKTRKIPENKVSVIQNWMDSSKFPVLPRENSWRKEIGVSAKQFLVLYAGTLGHVSGAGILIEVCKLLRHREDVVLVCVGEGVLKAEMQASAEAAGLRNFHFHPVQPFERVPEMHAAADATILTTQKNFPDASVPSKLVSYLAAGRAVVCAAPGGSTVARIVQEANAGISTSATDVESIAEAILFLADHKDIADRLGENARRCFEEQFTFKHALEKFTALLDQIVRRRSDVLPAESSRGKAEQISSR